MRRPTRAMVMHRSLGLLALVFVLGACSPNASSKRSTPTTEQDEIDSCRGCVWNWPRRTSSFLQSPAECLGPDGKPHAVHTESLRCKDRTTLHWNEYGWWRADNTMFIYPYNVVRALGDDGRPPKDAIDKCASSRSRQDTRPH